MSEYKEIMRMTQDAWDNLQPDLKKGLEDNPIVEVVIDG